MYSAPLVLVAVHLHRLHEEVASRQPASGDRSGEGRTAVEVVAVEPPHAGQHVELTQLRVRRGSARPAGPVGLVGLGHRGGPFRRTAFVVLCRLDS
jgi:hypothetical protein